MSRLALPALLALLCGQGAFAAGRLVVLPVAAPLGSAPIAGASVWTASPQLALPLSLPALAAAPVGMPRVALGARVSPTLGRAMRPLYSLAHAEDGGRRFDGAPRPEALQLELPMPGLSRTALAAPQPDGLPRYLSIANAEHKEWLADVMRVAWGSKTARRVFLEADKLARARGRPITVLVSELRANNGEYVYDWDMVRMGAHYLNRDPIDAAPTLVHELLHVAQKANLLPADALEMELEAYMVTFEVMRELGVGFEGGSFYKQAYRKFQGPLPAFIDWLASEYPTNIPLIHSRLSAYIAELSARRERSERRISRWDGKIKAAVAAVSEMMRTGQDARSIEVYRVDALAKLESSRREEALNLGWIERDLAMLRSAEGARRYRAYSRRVLDYTRRVHARYAAARDASRP